MVSCANGHGNQIPGGVCTVCGLALPAPGMQVWGAASNSSTPNPVPETLATSREQGQGSVPLPIVPLTRQPVTGAQGRATWRRGPWIAVAAIAIAFAVAGGTTYLVLTRPVPDVSGLSPAAAEAELSNAGFTDLTVTEEFSESVPRGEIVAQDPGPGTRARSGSAVSLVVSRGQPKEVPSLIGDTARTASSTLSNLDLEASTSEEPSNSVPEGVVLAQEPAPGTLVEEGARVSLTVSSGPPYTTVTVKLDLFEVVLDNNFTDCDDAITILRIFANSSIKNGEGRTLSTLSGLWDPLPGNGAFFPCEAVGLFPRTSTQEDTYRFLLDSSEPGSGTTYSRNQLESRNWIISLG